MKGNLFTDIYRVREECGEKSAEQAIEEIRSEVRESIENDLVPSKIRYLLFKVTNYCNSDCEYCTHARNRKPPEIKMNMPKEVIFQTIAEAAKLGVDAISISGGEPLIRDDIVEIVAKTASYGITPVLLTNGLLLPQKWDDLGKAGLKYVIISVDSVTPDIYKKQRGVELEDALMGIDAAVAMRKKYPGVEIHVSAVLTKDNQDDFFKLLNYMERRNIKVQISPYHKRDNDCEDYSINDKERIERLSEKLLQMKAAGYGIANSSGFLRHLPDFFCGGKVMPENFVCKAGYTNLTIDAYMNIKPCWSYVFRPIGNLKDNTLSEIWNGENMCKYRKKMLRCECEGCWYLCTSEVCMMLENQL